MNIESGSNSLGLPRIKWVQQMTAGTFGNQLLKMFIAAGAVIGAGIGLYQAGLFGLAVGVVVGAIGGLFFVGLGMPKNPNPRDQQDLQSPVRVSVSAEAEIERADDGSFLFSWMFKTPAGKTVGDTIPLDDFDTFEFGSSSDWFAGPHERGDFHEMFVIVLHSQTTGTQRVAAHAGSKAEISGLHSALTRAFVLNRPRPARPVAAAKRNRPKSGGGSSRDDLPTSL